jgi:hypothetical protein
MNTNEYSAVETELLMAFVQQNKKSTVLELELAQRIENLLGYIADNGSDPGRTS